MAERAKDVASRSVDPNEVLAYLQSKGVSKNHALGMIANIKYESGFNPTITEAGKNGGGGIGLFQHTGPRRKALLNYLNNDVTNWKGQIDFALSESSSKDYLSNDFKSPEQASHYFTTKWERPANAEVRGVQRQGFFKSFDGGKYATEVYNPTNVDATLDVSSGSGNYSYSEKGPRAQTASTYEVANVSDNADKLTQEEFRKQLEIETEKIKKTASSEARQQLEKEQNTESFTDALSKITYGSNDTASATDSTTVPNENLYVQDLPFEVQQSGSLFSINPTE